MISTSLHRLLEINYLNGNVTEVVGPPGGGKTAVITDWANDMNIRMGGKGPADVRIRARMPLYEDEAPAFGLIVANLSAMDVPDVAGVGIPQRDPETNELVMRNARPAMWPVPELHGDSGIILLDEYRSGEDSVRKPTSTLLLEGWLNGRSLPNGWRVVLASNRQSDNSGAYREFAMLNNRRCEIQFYSSFKAWKQWANKVGLPPLFVSFAEKHADVVFPAKVPDHEGAFCSPRSFVKALETWISYLTGKVAAGEDEITGRYKILANADHITEWLPEGEKEDILEAVAGWIGQAAANQLATHVMFAKEMPDLQDIIDDPMGAKIPGRTDARFVCGHMLSGHATADTFMNITRYVKRLGDDICIVYIQNSLQRNPGLYHTPAFSEWAAGNAAFAAKVLV